MEIRHVSCSSLIPFSWSIQSDEECESCDNKGSTGWVKTNLPMNQRVFVLFVWNELFLLPIFLTNTRICGLPFISMFVNFNIIWMYRCYMTFIGKSLTETKICSRLNTQVLWPVNISDHCTWRKSRCRCDILLQIFMRVEYHLYCDGLSLFSQSSCPLVCNISRLLVIPLSKSKPFQRAFRSPGSFYWLRCTWAWETSFVCHHMHFETFCFSVFMFQVLSFAFHLVDRFVQVLVCVFMQLEMHCSEEWWVLERLTCVCWRFCINSRLRSFDIAKKNTTLQGKERSESLLCWCRAMCEAGDFVAHLCCPHFIPMQHHDCNTVVLS